MSAGPAVSVAEGAQPSDDERNVAPEAHVAHPGVPPKEYEVAAQLVQTMELLAPDAVE